MKKLLIILALGSLTANATQPATPNLSPSIEDTLLRYAILEQYMKELTGVLNRIQDKDSAEDQARFITMLCTEMFKLLQDTKDPYQILPEIKTITDRRLMLSSRAAVEEAGLNLQKELIRLAENEFYGSATLIKTLQSLDILDDDADEFIR